MKKKLSVLALTLSMVLGMLSGCGSSTGEETPASTQTAPADSNASTVDLCILKEADEDMLNTYSVLAVNPDAPFMDADGNPVSDVSINTAGTDALIHWLLLPETLALAGNYGMDEYGSALFYVLEDAPTYDGEIPAATDDTRTIRLSTTTSVNDSGLLAYLLPQFEDAYGYTVEVQSAGTGKAIEAAKFGNADLILVHSKSQEEEFVNAGFSRIVDGMDSERLSFLYNYYVLCGPSADPAGVQDTASVLDAFAAIAEGKYPFVSRGDASGTHTKELSLWPADLGITVDAESFADYTDWYISANSGMGTCLVMAEEMGAYILTDKATFLTFVANNGVME